MPRPRALMAPEVLAEEDLRPLVGHNRSRLPAAMFAMGTWGSSTRFREQLMADSEFPLPGDLSAFLLVNQLVYRGVARPTDLADAIDTGRSNISKVVARLEARGLVMRVADPFDKRAVAVALTAAGREAGQRILDSNNALQFPADSDWTEDDAAELERLLVKLVRTLDALPEHPLSAASGVRLHSD